MFIKFAHQLVTIGLGVIGLGFITAFHEFGHFIFCKLFRISTPSFSVGFGPRLLQKKIGDTTFALSAIPMGGYVEIAGAQEVGQGEQKQALRKDAYSFNQKPYYQQMLVLGGGILFNLLFAYVTLTCLFMIGIGKSPMLYPSNATNVVESIVPDSPAARAGLLPGDTIIKINDQELPQVDPMRPFFEVITNTCINEVTLVVNRPGVEHAMSITAPLNAPDAPPRLGAIFEQSPRGPESLKDSLRASALLMGSWISGTFKSIASMFKKRSACGLSGPIAIIAETAKGAGHGMTTFFIILCFISVGLAMINLLPLPIFDGGQAVFYTLEAITGWSLDKARLYIHYASWVLVVGLMIYLSYKDILRILF